MPDAYLTTGTTTDHQEVAGTVTGGTATQAGKIVALDPTGKLDASILPTGVGQEVYVGTASGALTAGDFVYRSSGGISRASAASGGNGAGGYVTASAADGATGVVMYLDGANPAVTGVVAGQNYWLSDTTPGGFVTAPPTGTGKIVQKLGFGVTTTSIAFEPGPTTKRA